MSLLQRLFANVRDIEAAKADARVARARLLGTVEEIHVRLTPANILEEVLEEAKTRSTALAQNAGRTVRERPVVAVAGAAGIALFLARKPLLRLALRLLARTEETRGADHPFNP